MIDNAKLDQIRDELRWQPISEAPKDGTRLLMVGSLLGTETVLIGKWSLNLDQWWFDGGQSSRTPTHWMPLPAPPGKEAP